MKRLSIACLLVLAGCENTVSGGWTYSPFKGPGFDKEGNLQIEVEEGQEFVVATTYLPVGRGDSKDLFDGHMASIQSELWEDPEGLVGYSYAEKIVGTEYRTLSIWEDYDALYDFVLGPAHAAAIDDAPLIKDTGSTPMVGSWVVDGGSIPPDWEEVEERLADEGREAAY